MQPSPSQIRRNALVLTGAQALGGANPAIVISLGGLVGTSLAPQAALATLPVGLFQLGLALGTLPAAMVMRRLGRRAGYILGALLGALAGLVAAYGVYDGAFALFCAGTMIAGLYASYVQSYRFAAADGAAALGIQWHVLAMFGPSFYTGRLIQRFGKVRVTVAGLLLTSAAAVVALSGLGLAHFWVALVLLGLGWNFGFIGATALVTDCYAPCERARVQGLNDFLVFGSVATASMSSGQLLHAGGWQMVNLIVHPAVAAVLLLLAWQHARTSPAAR